MKEGATYKGLEKLVSVEEAPCRVLLRKVFEIEYTHDLGGKFLDCSDALTNLLGYSKEELLSLTLPDLVLRDEIPSLLHSLEEIGETGFQETPRVYHLEHKESGRIAIETIASLIYRDGKPYAVHGFARGISGRNRIEAGNSLCDNPGCEPSGSISQPKVNSDRERAGSLLKEIETRYHLFTENLNDSIWLMNMDLYFTYVSPSSIKVHGYTPEEVMSMSLRDLLSPASLALAEEILAFELQRSFDEPARSRKIEIELKRKQGDTIWAEVICSFIRDDEGRPVEILGIGRDITEWVRTREELRKINMQLSTLVQAMPDIVYFKDASGRNLEVNRAYEVLTGYSKKELIGRTDAEILPPDLAVQCRESDAMIMKHGKPLRFEESLTLKNGMKVSYDTIKAPIFDEAGVPIGVVGVSRDITERKDVENELRERELKYRFLTEKMTDIVWTMGLDLHTTYVSPSITKNLGFTPEERITQPVEEQMPPESLAAAVELLGYELARDGQEGVDPDRTITFEAEYCHKDGSTLWFENRITGIRDGSGTPVGLYGVSLNITESRKIREALRESEERFRDLAELLPECVYEIDLEGRATYLNRFASERFKFTQEDLAKKRSVFDAFVKEDLPRMKENMKKIIAGEQIGLNEYTALTGDGIAFPVMVHSTLITKEGKPMGLRGILIDISEKKNLEAHLMRAQKLEAIGTLAGGIAHDFNNLLMGILGNVSLLLMKSDETHPFHDRLKNIEEYVQRGSDLTKQLLGFARGGKYEAKPTNLGEFVARSSEMFGRAKKEIRIHRNIGGDLWSVEMDRGQMEQVLLNLFVNAWQAMPGGGYIFLTVSNAVLSQTDVDPYDLKPGRYVMLTVADTGVGMDETTKSRIFEPFFTTKERGRGTGLGLASAYGIIKNHGGFIHVESDKGAGSTFTICLPASDKDPEIEKRNTNDLQKGKGTILLIDDEDMILDVGKEMIRSLGYEVMTAKGGRTGLETYHANQKLVDLVILDLIMPDIGGKETYARLMEMNPAVNVLLSSGYSIDGQAKEILEKGCKGFIQKPFSLEELSKKLTGLIDQRTA